MKKNRLSIIIISGIVIGMLFFTMPSCKRSKATDPDVIPNAGFRISLSGTANPSTLYVPQSQPAVTSLITVRALNSNGTAAVNYDIIFQCDIGYFENYQVSTVRRTNGNGIAQITFFIPPGAGIRNSGIFYITATLVDDGRFDNTLAQVYDQIPLQVYPYYNQGVMIHGNVLTPSGNGVAGVTITLNGETGLADGVTVTRPSGSYEFYVAAGWYGTIEPSAPGYTFEPQSYIFDVSNPINRDIMDLNFIAIFATGDSLAADVTQWDDVPVEGGSQVVNVYNGTGDATIGYIVIPDSNWIHVSPNTGETPGSFTITVDENTTGDARTGIITINATDTATSTVTITINQLGEDVPSNARLAVDISNINVPEERTSVTINVYNSTTADTINYIVTSVPENDWISLSAVNGSTPSTLTITADDNYGPARSGQVILTPTSTGVSNTVIVYVNQEGGASLAIDIQNRSVPVGGEVFMVSVTNPTNSDPVNFTVTNTDTWITFSPANAATPSQVSITVSANATGQLRSGVITFTPASGEPVKLTVTQQG